MTSRIVAIAALLMIIAVQQWTENGWSDKILPRGRGGQGGMGQPHRLIDAASPPAAVWVPARKILPLQAGKQGHPRMKRRRSIVIRLRHLIPARFAERGEAALGRG